MCTRTDRRIAAARSTPCRVHGQRVGVRTAAHRQQRKRASDLNVSRFHGRTLRAAGCLSTPLAASPKHRNNSVLFHGIDESKTGETHDHDERVSEQLPADMHSRTVFAERSTCAHDMAS